MVPKSIRNDLGLLYGVLGSAEKRGWVASSPCKHVELPRAGTHDDGDIPYLSPDEVEALCRAVPDDDRGCTERLRRLPAGVDPFLAGRGPRPHLTSP